MFSVHGAPGAHPKKPHSPQLPAGDEALAAPRKEGRAGGSGARRVGTAVWSPGNLSSANWEHSVGTRMRPQRPWHLRGGIRLGAEVVSPGDTGKSLEVLEGGNREEKSHPTLIEGEKAPGAGEAGRKAGRSV